MEKANYMGETLRRLLYAWGMEDGAHMETMGFPWPTWSRTFPGKAYKDGYVAGRKAAGGVIPLHLA